jgi:hypothetical protein
MANAVMMQSAAFLQRNADHCLLGSSGSLLDGFWHFACLALAKASATLAITHHNECRKAEALAALHCFGNAVDVNQLLNQFFAAIVSTLAALVIPATPVAITASASTITTSTRAAAASAARCTSTRCFTFWCCYGRFDHSFGFISHY